MSGGDGPIIVQTNETAGRLSLVPKLADVSAGTEFGSYKEPQWRFLLQGEDITAFAIQFVEDENELDTARRSFDGCVLRVELGDNTHGMGMVLVRPSHRGRGLAKALIERAMQIDDANKKRFALAVCSELGQPLYRKMGFKESGVVTCLTCSVSDMMQVSRERFANEYLLVSSGKRCIETSEQFTLLAGHDAQATGINRRDRIKLLLEQGDGGSLSTVAFFGTAGKDLHRLSTAVAWQDCSDGPLNIGPMKGKEECCIPLIRTLIEKHLEGEAREDSNNMQIMMMVTDHPNLVERLLKVKGMKEEWSRPAMTSDGRPFFQDGDGSYLAMMHPTLG